MAQEQRVETHASRDGEDKRPRSPRQGTAANRGVFRAASWITMAFWPGAAAGCCCSRPGTRLGAPCCPASSAEMRAVTDLGGRGPLAAVLRVHTACRGEDDSGWQSSLRRRSGRCCAVQTCSVQRAVRSVQADERVDVVVLGCSVRNASRAEQRRGLMVWCALGVWCAASASGQSAPATRSGRSALQPPQQPGQRSQRMQLRAWAFDGGNLSQTLNCHRPSINIKTHAALRQAQHSPSHRPVLLPLPPGIQCHALLVSVHGEPPLESMLGLVRSPRHRGFDSARSVSKHGTEAAHAHVDSHLDA
jgi:hypothetical protein